MIETIIKKEQTNSCFFQNKKILIIADTIYQHIADTMIQCDIDALQSSDILKCTKNEFYSDQYPVKVSFFKKYFPKKVWSSLGLNDNKYDVLFYLGEHKSILQLAEKWSKNCTLIYVGRLNSKSAMIHFLPEDNSKYSAQAFCNLLTKLNI